MTMPGFPAASLLTGRQGSCFPCQVMRREQRKSLIANGFAAPRGRFSGTARNFFPVFPVRQGKSRSNRYLIGGTGRLASPGSITKVWFSVYQGAVTSGDGGSPPSWRR
jgi:hypothetical protein